VFGVLNDGGVSLTAAVDPVKHLVGSCFMDYRNSGVNFVKVVYQGHTLTISVDSKKKGQAFEPCFAIKNIKLPSGYYFGVSASAGSLAGK
jgi:hypothetical protein